MSGTTFSKLPVMIVALVIGLILTFTAVMPLVSDYSDAKTFKNEGYYRMSEITSDTDVTIVWDYTKPYELTVGTATISLSDVPINQPVTIYGTDEVVVRFENRGDAGVVMQSFNDSTYVAVSIAAAVNMTITASGYTLNGSFGTTEISEITSTKGFIIDPNGNYIMKDKNSTAYLLKDDIFALSGVTLWGDVRVGIYAEGSIKDGIAPDTVYLNSVTSVSYSDITINDTEDGKYTDLYAITSCQLQITTDGTVRDVTYSYFIVPAEVTAETSNPAVYKNLVSVLPLFALILLVAGAASLIYFKNKD